MFTEENAQIANDSLDDMFDSGNQSKNNTHRKQITMSEIQSPSPINEFKNARVTKMNHITEVMVLAVEPKGFLKIKKLNKNEYVDLTTGEIKSYEQSDNRSEFLDSYRETLKRIRRLINNNFDGSPNELHIILTLGGEKRTKCPRKYYKLFDIFWKRFKRAYSDAEYLSVVEPQQDGTWHTHLLVKFTEREKIFIANNNELEPMWGNGWTKIKSLKDVDNIGAYLSAYLTDIDLSSISNDKAAEIIHEIGDSVKIVRKEFMIDGKKGSKRFIKGGRLYMYPSGMNIYRKSKGIVMPETVQMPYFKAKEIAGSDTPDYSKTLTISLDDRPVNQVTYEHYNQKRKKEK